MKKLMVKKGTECMACLVDYYGEQFICSVYIEMSEAGPLELSYEEIKH